MRVLYATLTAVFVILILQSYSVRTPEIFAKLDSSIKRTDSIIVETKKHVSYLDYHHSKDMHKIDSLNAEICKLKTKQYAVKVIKDTVFIK